MNSTVKDFTDLLRRSLDDNRYSYVIAQSALFLHALIEQLGISPDKVSQIYWGQTITDDLKNIEIAASSNSSDLSLIYQVPNAADVILVRAEAYLRENHWIATRQLTKEILHYLPTHEEAKQFDLRLKDYSPESFFSLRSDTKYINSSPLTLACWTLSNAKVCGTKGLVVLADGLYPQESSPGNHLASLHDRILNPAAEIKSVDTLIPLNGNCGDNFWHWTIEQLPRLAAALALHLEGIFLIPSKAPFILESLKAFGVPESRILVADPKIDLQCKTIHLIEHPDRSQQSYPLYKIVRDKILHYCNHTNDPKVQSSAIDPLKLYVTRHHSRVVINEAAVQEVLTRHGFQTVCFDDLSFKDQIQLVAKANYFVGPHGATFTHSLFLPEKSTIIELFSPDYVNPCMTHVNRMFHHRYQMLVALNNTRKYPYADDIEVPIDELELLLEQ